MNASVATALMQMGQAVTERRAAGWAAIARARGADPDTITRAWAEWRQLQAEQVQVIGNSTCLCSHHASHHSTSGECWSAACGCRVMRPAS